MNINIDKMDTFKFVVCVFIFILIFCLIFTIQTRSIVNMQNKLLEKYLDDQPKITQPKTTTDNLSKYTPATQNEIKKYQNYDY